MRKLFFTVGALALGVASANAASFNFETTAAGDYNVLAVNDSGVTLTLSLTNQSVFQIADTGFGGPDAFGDRTLSNFFPTCCTAAPVQRQLQRRAELGDHLVRRLRAER